MRRSNRTICALLTAAVLAGCSDSAPEFYSERFTSEAGECENPDQRCAQVVLEYPVFEKAGGTTDQLNAVVMQHLLKPYSEGTTPRSPDALAADFISGYEKLTVDFPDYQFGWQLRRTIEIVLASPHVVSLSSFEYVYSGGAHPNSFKQYISVDLDNGHIVLLDDIVALGSMDALERVAEARFRQVRMIPAEQSFEDAGFTFDGGVFSLNDNFAVLDAGLMFYFNGYEIAPYALGPTELFLPFDTIADLLVHTGPVAHVMP